MSYIPKSKTDKWQTPTDLYKLLDDEFKFNFDPCPIDWNPLVNPDGLSIEWGSSTFCNPPYSNVSKWIKKAYDETYNSDKVVVMLINAITDTIAFHKYIYGKMEIRFIKGRLKFINPENPTNLKPNVKASMIVIFKRNSN